MKKKILISGANQTFLNDFFANQPDDMICLSTSENWEDVKGHYNEWYPDAYVCLVENRNSLQMSILSSLSENTMMLRMPVVVITQEEFRSVFEGGYYKNIAMVLYKPISIVSIFLKIRDMFVRLELEKKMAEEEKKRQLEAQKLQAAAAIANVQQSMANTGSSILVVDDDRNILKLVKVALEDKYNIATMPNGKMAEKYLETRDCDLILLDYEMPGENGPEVYKRIRANVLTKDIPIVFLTGVKDREKIAEVLKLKPQGYLLKPINVEKLKEAVKQYVH